MLYRLQTNQLRLCFRKDRQPLIHLTNYLLSKNKAAKESEISMKIPLINNSGLLYSTKQYSKRKISKVLPFPVYCVPGVALTLYYQLEGGWTILNGIISFLVLFSSLLTRHVNSNMLSQKIQAIQVNRNLHNYYFTVSRSRKIDTMLQRNFSYYHLEIKRAQYSPEKYLNLQDIYIPGKNYASKEMSSTQQRQLKAFLLDMQFNARRIEIRKEEIKSIKYLINQKEEIKMEEDKKLLKFKQFAQKYGNKVILIEVNAPGLSENTNFTFNLSQSNNIADQCRHYFTALIYGYKIRPQFIPKSSINENKN